MAVDQTTVLADPTKAGVARQCAFQHRRGIDECAIAECTDRSADPVRQLLQPATHQLVVIATQRVAGNVGALAIGERAPCLAIVAAVILAHANGAAGAGHQMVWLCAQISIARHVIHVAVLALCQPVEQVLVISVKRRLHDAGLGKAQLKRPLPDIGSQLVQIDHRNDSIEISGYQWRRKMCECFVLVPC